MKTLDTLVSETAGLLCNNQEIIDSYNNLPIPTKHLEDWKFFDASSWFESKFDFSFKSSISKDEILETIGNIEFDSLLVFNNSEFDANLSELQDGVNCLSNFKSCKPAEFNSTYNFTHISEQGKFESLNTICAKDGAHINISKSQNIVIVSAFSGENTFSFQRNIICTNKNAAVNVTEISISKNDEKICINNVVEILVGENSNIEYTSLQKLGNNSQFVQSIAGEQEAGSKILISTFPISGKYVRTNIWIDKNAENANTHLKGIIFPAKNEQFEVYAWANHNKPKCETHELFKGLAKENGVAVFSGKIFVAKGAQKTFATQSNKNILLSNDAKIYSKPQLEIYADDVSCSHGSTTGQVNKEALWYMQARGIKAEKAISLLLEGFINDVSEFVSNEFVRNSIVELITRKI